MRKKHVHTLKKVFDDFLSRVWISNVIFSCSIFDRHCVGIMSPLEVFYHGKQRKP